MKKTLLTVALLAVGALAASPALAAATPVATADIPNAFTFAGKSLPAGKYTVLVESAGGLVIVQNDATGKKEVAEYVTRLAMMDLPQPELVFDKVGDTLYLSEIRLTDEDGYQVPGATAKQHTHVRVKAQKKKA
jgi:hypothetical protein